MDEFFSQKINDFFFVIVTKNQQKIWHFDPLVFYTKRITTYNIHNNNIYIYVYI